MNWTFCKSSSILNVILKLRPIAGFRKEIISKYEFITGLVAGKLFSMDYNAQLEFSTAKSIWELLNGNNKILSFLDALSFKLFICSNSNSFQDLISIAGKSAGTDDERVFCSLIELLKSGNLNFDFQSGNELQDDIKELLKLHKINNLQLLPLHKKGKEIFRCFGNGGSGSFHIFSGFQANALYIEFHLTDLLKFCEE